MVADSFIDAFGDFLEDHTLLIHLVQSLFKAVHSSFIETRESIIKSVMSILNIPQDNYKNITDQYLTPVFQEYSLNIFKLTEDHHKQIKHKLIQHLNTKDLVNNWLNSTDLNNFIEILHRLYVYMELNGIELPINSTIEYKEFKKELYHCLDGFPREGTACAVIIPSPMKEGKPYQSIKPAIIIAASHSIDIKRIEDSKIPLSTKSDPSPLKEEPLGQRELENPDKEKCTVLDEKVLSLTSLVRNFSTAMPYANDKPLVLTDKPNYKNTANHELKMPDSDFYYNRSKELKKRLNQIKELKRKSNESLRLNKEWRENKKPVIQEKLLDYKQILVNKIQSLKNCNKSRSSYRKIGTIQQSLKKSNYNTVKASFRTIISELNVKLTKYKQAVLAYEFNKQPNLYPSNVVSANEYGIKTKDNIRIHKKGFPSTVSHYTLLD